MLITIALYYSNFEWFGACLWKPTPKDLPSSRVKLMHKGLTHVFTPLCACGALSICHPKVSTGLIASGDKFVTDYTALPMLENNPLPTVAVEMEGAAIAQICHDYDIPYIVFRTISDLADSTSAVDFQQFEERIARHYSLGIVKNLLSVLSKEHSNKK